VRLAQKGRSVGLALGLAAFLAAYNNVVHLLPGHAVVYVPLNLSVTAALTWLGKRSGLTWADLGMGRAPAARGLRWGAALAGVVTVAYLVLYLSPGRQLLADQRYAGTGTGELAYHALVRIPLGTVVFEEVAFRGVLLAALARARSVPVAVAVSSALFGLWHIRPTLGALDANSLATSPASEAAAVGAAVGFTGLAGALFAWLRLRSESLVAPVLLHTATNSVGAIAAFLAHRGL
jgi:membrane protease YdiL (CAAX protease family)